MLIRSTVRKHGKDVCWCYVHDPLCPPNSTVRISFIYSTVTNASAYILLGSPYNRPPEYLVEAYPTGRIIKETFNEAFAAALEIVTRTCQK